MEWVHTAEQLDIGAGLRRLLAEKCGSETVRAAMASPDGSADALSQQLDAQLGLSSLAIPEEYGGAGLGQTELALVQHELGRVVAPTPFFASSVLAANALLAAGDEAARAELLPGIAEGSVRATLALTEESGLWDLEAVRTTATRTGDGWTLDGVKAFVVDGHVADLVVVVARAPEGLGLFAVDGTAPGLTRAQLSTLDQTRRQARLELSATPARSLARPGTDVDTLARALDLAALGLAAELVGGAEACLEASIAYAKERVQFGRQIGSFQSIKHQLAEHFLAIESAKSAVHYAAQQADTGGSELGLAASIAKAYAADAYWDMAVANVHLHGGIGFTWEHDAHLHYKRAKSMQLYLGDAVHHRELIARRLGLQPLAG